MNQKIRQTVYRIQEFAKLTGVTVRALRHYDRLDLLTPTARSRSGYRLYRDQDVARVEQIMVLKFLGLSLARIGHVLRRQADLRSVLGDQQRVLGERRTGLAFALETIERTEQRLASGGEPDWHDLACLVREIGVQFGGRTDSPKARLEHARRKILDRRMNWNATLEDYQLSRDVRSAAARGTSLASPEGVQLVARWKEVIERFVGGDPDMREALRLVAAERHWPIHPSDARTRDSVARIHEFYETAIKSA